jgi:hypothetical protein
MKNKNTFMLILIILTITISSCGSSFEESPAPVEEPSSMEDVVEEFELPSAPEVDLSNAPTEPFQIRVFIWESFDNENVFFQGISSSEFYGDNFIMYFSTIENTVMIFVGDSMINENNGMFFTSKLYMNADFDDALFFFKVFTDNNEYFCQPISTTPDPEEFPNYYLNGNPIEKDSSIEVLLECMRIGYEGEGSG